MAAALPDLEELLYQLKQWQKRAAVALQRRLQQEKQLLDYTVSSRFYRRPQQRLQRAQETLQRLEAALHQEAVRGLKLKGMKLASLDDRLEAFSPLKVMNRGYCYCRDEAGQIVRSIREVRVGGALRLTFKDGQARCRTEAVEEGTGLER